MSDHTQAQPEPKPADQAPATPVDSGAQEEAAKDRKDGGGYE